MGIQQIGQDIRLDFTYSGDIKPDRLQAEAEAARATLEGRQGPGNDFLGWLDLPAEIADADLDAIQKAATKIREAEALIVVGIGGSYLGARAVIEALRQPFAADLPIYYAGHQMDARYHGDLMRHLADKRYAVNVISKSGTTTEPGLAFRFLWKDLSQRYAGDLKDLVFATTDASKGSLRILADRAGLQSFVIPDDVGGRFSVFTPVGLLPIAAAGLDIRELVAGARAMRAHLQAGGAGRDFANNPALQYVAYRNAAYRAGK